MFSPVDRNHNDLQHKIDDFFAGLIGTDSLKKIGNALVSVQVAFEGPGGTPVTMSYVPFLHY